MKNLITSLFDSQKRISWAEQTGGQVLFPTNTENIEAVAMNVPLPV